MANNFLSRLLPSGGEPSIYETLRQDDASNDIDLEERAGMATREDSQPAFQDEPFDASNEAASENITASHNETPDKFDAHPSSSEFLSSKSLPKRPAEVEAEELDEDVPQSLLVEDRDDGIPSLPPQRQTRHSSTIPEVTSRVTRANWQAMQEQQELGDNTIPPPISSRNGKKNAKLGVSQDPKEKALWFWANVSNLDIFLRDVYDYFLGNGIWCITLSRLLNLFTIAFVVAFSTFLLTCIDLKVVPQSRSMDEILISQCTRKWSGSTNLLIWLFSFYWIYKFFETLWDLKRLRQMQQFFNYLLEVSDSDIQTVAWQQIVKKLMDLRDQNASTAANVRQAHQRFLGTQSKQRMDAHDIANRLMRRDNYLIALINKDVLDLTLPLPFLKNRQLFSKTLEWNLSLCILDHVFDERGQVRPFFLKDTHRRALSDSLRRRFLFAGFMNAICAPFIVLFFVLFYFFRYFNEFQRNPAQIGSRQYTPLAEWKFREFNELWHFFERRANMSLPFASRYMDQFPKDKTIQLAKFVAFVAGAVASVLAAVSVFDTESFLAFELTPQRSVLFYLGIFGSIWAVARGAVPAENIVFDPEFALKDVISYTRYMPSNWMGRLHTNEIRAEFANLYKMKILIFVEELLSILLTPFVLWFSLPARSDRIIDFFREFTIHVDGLGYVCSFAVFDFKRGGNRTSQPDGPIDQKLRQEYYSTKDGKMLASYYGFIDNYVTSQRPGAPFLHPEPRQSFHAPPAFPGMMASNWLTDVQGPGRGSRYDRHTKAPDRSVTSGHMPGNRSTYPRTPRFGPTLEQTSPMASVLLDPQNQPSHVASRSSRKPYSQSRLRSSRKITSGPTDSHAGISENPTISPYENHDGDNEDADMLSESWKTTQAGYRDEDPNDDMYTAEQDKIPGVLGLVYQFSKAQNDGRGAGVSI